MSEKIEASIASLAEHLLAGGATERFRALAKTDFDALCLSSPDELSRYFHHPPAESPQFDVHEHGLGGWLSSCQFAVFELIYNFGEDALPFLRKIAWGEYDWIQCNAIELMIRLAADGVATKEIIADIRAEFPGIRHEASLYAIEPLISRLDREPDLKRVFDQLLSIAEFKTAFDELMYVDPDPYNLDSTDLHATVTSARRVEIEDVLGERIVATIEVDGLRYYTFKPSRGRARLYVSDKCLLVKQSGDDVVPISIEELLRSRKVALARPAMYLKESRLTCYCPSFIAAIETP